LIKLLLKLAVVALVANMAWQLMNAYMSYYKFKDAVQQTTQFGPKHGIEQLRTRVMQLAADYDVPLAEDDLIIKREGVHTITDATYTRPVDLLPWYTRPWTFSFHLDTFSDAPEVPR
jgi:hypothetical protein